MAKFGLKRIQPFLRAYKKFIYSIKSINLLNIYVIIGINKLNFDSINDIIFTGKIMKKLSKSEKLILDEIIDAAHKLKISSRGLAVGEMIAMIRHQLGMSQKVLARLAGVPQSTVSRIEGSKRDANLSTLQKILKALSCEVIIVPMLMEPIDVIRRKQARRVAENNVRYLRGTMSLEKQEPDTKIVQELINEEEDELLRSPGKKLWQE